ncbi:LysR family transcriptional regulator [Amycolatopsis jejuensis]|uniref:LysR family transcriptional regulator n=1 Tax=Amycolatopsis jejuensis TaxID=330084 RepID=UPI0005276EC7|nr:LysR family transcriptional regulator [Amycolatopsis jejuensis]
MITLHQLRCFLAASEYGSFASAAAQLGYAPATLSEHINLLERAVQTRLFERRGRGVVPTPAGDALRPHAERAVAAVAEAERAAKSAGALESGTVRVGMYAHSVIDDDLIAKILQEYPGLHIEIVGRSSTEAIDALRHGLIDVAFATLPIANEDDFDIRPIAQIEHVFTSKDPAVPDREVTAHDLASASLVLANARERATDSFRVRLAERVQRLGLTLTIRAEVESGETAIKLVDRGVGSTVVPLPLLRKVAPHLSWVPLQPKFHDTVVAVHWRGAEPSAGSRLATSLAEKCIRRYASPGGNLVR